MITLVLHGGAGAIKDDDPLHQQYEKSLSEYIDKGFKWLESGRTAVEVVTEVVRLLEDDPLFNAGRGSVLCSDGRVQMDAAIMCGKTEACGAVTLIEQIKNPILAAKSIMEKSDHYNILGGKDAEIFAKNVGLELVDNSYFVTERMVEHLRMAKAEGLVLLDHDSDNSHTVGAVALDSDGNLAAATSTGGLTNKRPGRVSDSSIIGAGTYANNKTLAISATGTGSVFVQNVSGFDAHALIKYGKLSLENACSEVLKKVKEKGGTGGVIAVDPSGTAFMGFNSSGMFRAMRNSKNKKRVQIF